MTRRRRGREFWERIIGEGPREGETWVSVAARHGVREKTLSWWRGELRRNASGPASIAMLPVRAREDSPDTRLRMTARGVTIDIPSSVSAEYIASLVRALGALGA